MLYNYANFFNYFILIIVYLFTFDNNLLIYIKIKEKLRVCFKISLNYTSQYALVCLKYPLIISKILSY